MNKILLSVAFLLGGVLVLPSVVDAYRGDPNVQGPNYTEERHEAITTALENKDYDTWSENMQGRGVAEKVNEGNFAKYIEAHQLSLQGDTEGAAQVRAELGLGNGQRLQNGNGTGVGMRVRGSN